MRKPRIIVYNDEQSLLDLLEACFSKWGCEVFSYRYPVVCPVNGNSVHGCKCQEPCADLMLSDFLLPQMTGTELFWRQAERGCKVAAKAKAIMSGYSKEKLLRFCENSGYRYFEKPLDYKELIGWLGECWSNYDPLKQLGGSPEKVRYESRQGIEHCLNSSGLQEECEGWKIVSPVQLFQASLN